VRGALLTFALDADLAVVLALLVFLALRVGGRAPGERCGQTGTQRYSRKEARVHWAEGTAILQGGKVFAHDSHTAPEARQNGHSNDPRSPHALADHPHRR